MSLTIHAVPFNSTSLTAECGQRLGRNGHTGHFRPLRAFDDAVVCEACQPTTDARVSAALDAAQEGMAEAVLRYVNRCTWSGDCLVLRDDGKYGQVSWGSRSQRQRTTAHRAAHMVFTGPLGADEVARHRCDNPPCVNPAHIEGGTVAENVRDAYDRDRRLGVRAGVPGEANPSAILTERLVVQLRREVRSGISIRQVARNHGIDYSSAYSAVMGKTWGHVAEPTAQRVRKGHPNPRRTPPEVVAKAVELANSGMSLGEIAEAIGVHRSTVFSILRRADFRRSEQVAS